MNGLTPSLQNNGRNGSNPPFPPFECSLKIPRHKCNEICRLKSLALFAKSLAVSLLLSHYFPPFSFSSPIDELWPFPCTCVCMSVCTYRDLLVVGSFMTITSVMSPNLLKYSRRLSVMGWMNESRMITDDARGSETPITHETKVGNFLKEERYKREEKRKQLQGLAKHDLLFKWIQMNNQLNMIQCIYIYI